MATEYKLDFTANEINEKLKKIDNKLDATALDSTIETALTEAKESGEFDGVDGKSAYEIAKDGGYTGTESEFAEKLAESIPTILPNPNAITINGTSYDGSEAVDITDTINSLIDEKIAKIGIAEEETY